MMKRAIAIAAVVSFLAGAGGTAGATDVRKVRSIGFRGLSLLTKYDAIRGARLRAVSDGIIVDMESVERVLSQNSFIESYRVDESNGGLVISVEEKQPVLILAVERRGGAVLFELGADGAALSKDDVHTARVPVLLLASGDFTEGGMSARARGLISLLGRVRSAHKALYRELAEVRAAGGEMRVTLRGRKTEYILRPEPDDFTRLNYVAGYCDRIERYPEEINLTGNAVIVR